MQRAERFGPLAGGTPVPYDEEKRQPPLYSRWLDPLLLWSLNRCHTPRILMLLHNWGNWWPGKKEAVGTVMGCENWTQAIWNDEVRNNRSFRNLFRTSWSKQLIQSGQCLVANAVWGIWLSKKANG